MYTKHRSKQISLFLTFLLVLLLVPRFPVNSVKADAEIEVLKVLFSGEKSADAWSTALTVNSPDTTLLSPDTMVQIVSTGNAAPALILSSWSGGEAWANILPCANVNGALFYSYADMTTAFGTDLSLVNSISVMNRSAAAVIYEVSIVTAASVAAAESSDKPVRRVVGYLPDWSYSAYKSMDFSLLTHINIAFCMPNADGVLSCMIPDDELHKIVSHAHENNVSVLASLGGAGGSDVYPSLMKTAESRASFNAHILEFCKEFELDGVDLDIEGDVDEVFWETYEDWCLTLRAMCDENELILSSATAYWIAIRNSDKALACFDYLNIMAYDNDTDPASHSTMEFAVESLNQFHIERGIQKSRLVLGVPFYGRGYNADGTLSWTSYVPFAELVGADPDNYNKDLYDGIAYNGAETMCKKCALAKQYGGVMIWELTQDASGENSLLSVIGKSLLSPLLPGDLNGDGCLTAADAMLLKQFLVQKQIDFIEPAAADYYSDGIVNAFDLCLLKKTLLAS